MQMMFSKVRAEHYLCAQLKRLGCYGLLMQVCRDCWNDEVNTFINLSLKKNGTSRMERNVATLDYNTEIK